MRSIPSEHRIVYVLIRRLLIQLFDQLRRVSPFREFADGLTGDFFNECKKSASEIALVLCLHCLLQDFGKRLFGIGDLTLLSEIRVQTARFLVRYRWNRSQRLTLRSQYCALAQ
jgi:hypothetical protein